MTLLEITPWFILLAFGWLFTAIRLRNEVNRMNERLRDAAQRLAEADARIDELAKEVGELEEVLGWHREEDREDDPYYPRGSPF